MINPTQNPHAYDEEETRNYVNEKELLFVAYLCNLLPNFEKYSSVRQMTSYFNGARSTFQNSASEFCHKTRRYLQVLLEQTNLVLPRSGV